ncbi:MAG TPA: ParA family protein [Cyclobacteriaceae bacterium]|nr:ParA family protein [Cyclobacteriaceae bacterium]
MAKIICVTNLKGGVSKTTSTANLGAALARMGYRVLIVDWDPQGNLTTHFGIEDENLKTLFQALDPAVKGYHHVDKLHAYGLEQYPGKLFLLANNFTLAKFEGTFTGTLPGFQFVLKKALENFDDRVDFVLIDTQPSLSVLTINAFCAADHLMIPMEADKFSENGLDQILFALQQIHEYYGKTITVAGAFFAKHKANTVISKKYEAYFKSDRSEIPVMKTVIRDGVALKECKEIGMDIFSYDNMLNERNKKNEVSNGSEDYYNLANEMLYNIGMREEVVQARVEVQEKPKSRKNSKGDLKSEFKEFING